MPYLIDAIIVNYNAGALIKACVSSLRTCPNVSKIIIVDNASIDNSLVEVEGLSNVFIIQNDRNMGFATACNLGMSQSSANYLLFINPDCSFSSGTLQYILNVLISGDMIGMAGGLLSNQDGSEQAGSRRAIPTPWRSFVRAFGLNRLETRWPRLFFDFFLHQQPLPNQPIEVEAISGACMLVKREAIDDVGLWDEEYFLHCEDLDLCMRFRQKGWKIFFVPDAKITHIAGSCSKSRPIFVEWHKHKGMLRFYRKFFRHQYPGVLMWLVVLGVGFRFILVAGYHLSMRFSFLKQ